MSRASRIELDAYFERHGIRDLLRDITEQLAFLRPDDPLSFILDKCRGLQGIPPSPPGPARPANRSALDAIERQNASAGRRAPVAGRLPPLEKAAHGQGSTARPFELQLRVEATGWGGHVVRHVTRRVIGVPDRNDLVAWQEQADAALTEACRALLGETGPAKECNSRQREVSSLPLEDDLKLAKSLVEQEKATDSSKDRAGDARKILGADEAASTRAAAADVYRKRKHLKASSYINPIEANMAQSLRIIFTNDCYDLQNLAVFDSVVKEHRTPNTLVVIPGDFVSNTASILDQGSSAIEILNRIGVNYVCFGRSETHIRSEALQTRISEFKGKWLNSNMPEFRPILPEYDVLEFEIGAQSRKVAFIGLCSHGDTGSFKHGQSSFGGVWRTAQSVSPAASKLTRKLVEELGCDLVVPLTNQRMVDDVAMAKAQAVDGGNFNFPVIIGGHGHEPISQTLHHGANSDGIRSSSSIIKCGVGRSMAAIVDLVWPTQTSDSSQPQVSMATVSLDDYRANEELAEIARKAANNSRNIDSLPLATVPCELLPLSSSGTRRKQTGVGSILCNLVVDALQCDGAALAGAIIRGDRVYGKGMSEWTLADLKREVPHECPLAVIPLPGAVLQHVVLYSRQEASREPPVDSGGFLQLDQGMLLNEDGSALTHVRGCAFDPEKVYQVCFLSDSLLGMYRNQPLIDFANSHPEALPDDDHHLVWCKDTILKHAVGKSMRDTQADQTLKVMLSSAEFVTKSEVSEALRMAMGGDGPVPSHLIDNVMNVIDTNHDGSVSRDEFNTYMRVFKKLETLKSQADQCALRIISVNDVYEITNFPALHNLILDNKTDNTLVFLPGDFVAPSLLSSLDRGKGMIDMMNRVGETGVNYVCFGNHEADIPPEELRKRISEFNGKWINSNMPDWRPELPEYDIFHVESGGQKRKIAVLGLNTVDKNLYQKGAFAGAMENATPVIETAARLRKKLIEQDGCDLVIPMTHQVMPEDRLFAEEFKEGFPIIIGAHDHDPYLETVAGATIVKTGADAVRAAIIDIVWPDMSSPEVKVSVDMVETSLYLPDPHLTEVMRGHLRVVEELEAAYVAPVDPTIQLYSTKMRREQTPIGSMLTSLIRDGLRSAAASTEACDGVMMDAGALRRNFEYPSGYDIFTFGDLKKEIPFPSEIVVVKMPGSVVAAAVAASRSKAFNHPPEDWGGYLQLDDGFAYDTATNTVTHINGAPLEASAEYNIGCLYLSLSGMNRNQALIDFANTINGDAFTQLGDAGRGAKELIVDCCSRNILAQLGSFEDIDVDHDGEIDLSELEAAMEKMLGRPPVRIELEQMISSLKAIDPTIEAESTTISEAVFRKAMQAHISSSGRSSRHTARSDTSPVME